MNSTFLIKQVVYGVLVLLPFFTCAQENETFTESDEAENSLNNDYYIVSVSVGHHNLIPTGDNFAGQGLKAGSGFNVKTHLYIYDRIFAGVAFGEDYLRVKDTELLGVYQKTSISNQYFYLGYEFAPLERLRLSGSIGLFGNVEYRNQGWTNYRKIKQKDTGKSNFYGLSLDYRLAWFVFVYLDYSYRTDKTNIDAPQELQDFFERANYHSLAIGIRLRFGNRAIFK